MLLRIWTFPMNALAWLLVKVTGCTAIPCDDDQLQGDWREYVAPAGGLLQRWFDWQGFAALTPSAHVIIWRDLKSSTSDRLLCHEIVHVLQHCRYGPFFSLVYGWYSLVSKVKGTGWYQGNELEREARLEVRR